VSRLLSCYVSTGSDIHSIEHIDIPQSGLWYGSYKLQASRITNVSASDLRVATIARLKCGLGRTTLTFLIPEGCTLGKTLDMHMALAQQGLLECRGLCSVCSQANAAQRAKRQSPETKSREEPTILYCAHPGDRHNVMYLGVPL
jgi:hypothetical protein